MGSCGWEICVIASSKLHFFEKDDVTVLRDYLLDCRDLRKLQEESKGPAWETNGLVSPSRPPGSGICATRLDSCLGLEQLPRNSLTKPRACVGAGGRDGGRGRAFHLLRSCPRLCFSAAAPCPPIPARAQADVPLWRGCQTHSAGSCCSSPGGAV